MSDHENFERAIESLLDDRSPCRDAIGLDDEEQKMLRMAQLLRGSRQEATAPEAEFVAGLRERVVPGQPRVTRRTAFRSGLGALAAGILGGIGIDRLHHQSPTPDREALVGNDGRWVDVAVASEVPAGAVRSFTAGNIPGFLINHDGEFRALSRICTHMGCALDFARAQQGFVCPCHGAAFDLRGFIRHGPGRYPDPLPPLPELRVRVQDESVQVWSV
ncbi:MAG: hypothetical protein DLM70_04370 [Chloroflexi bacterium]|nr:MAG: hypothetical protein DLM70_04370 [Chloroflexota bacterium]